MNKKLFVAIIALLALLLNRSMSEAKPVTIGLFVGSNQGSIDDSPLQYAESDARRMYRVFSNIGHLDTRYSKLMVGPTAEEILAELIRMQKLVQKAHARGDDVLFLYYHSGHGDGHSLHLTDHSLSFLMLTATLEQLDADILVGIFDTCNSGAITHVKGGTRDTPFSIQVRERANVRGNVYLTSSSAREISHESDDFGSSLFTYYLLSGLRGAADYNNDKHITLSEIYRYTYINTLRASSELKGVLQHPHYKYNLSGNGDLVLTSLPLSSVHLIFPQYLRGTYYITSEDTEELFTEVHLEGDKTTEISLPRGSYTIRKKDNGKLLIDYVNLRWGGDYYVDDQKMAVRPLRIARKKGAGFSFPFHRSSFFLLSSEGSGMYQGMEYYPQLGFGYSRRWNSFDAGMTFSFSRQNFSYQGSVPISYEAYHENLFIRHHFSRYPMNNYLIPLVGVSFHAFQASAASQGSKPSLKAMNWENSEKPTPLRGLGIGFTAGFSIPLPRDTSLTVMYEMQVLWSDTWTQYRPQESSMADDSRLKGSGIVFDSDPITIAQDPDRKVQNVARHSLILTFSYLF